MRTLTALREFESVIRWGLSRMAHYQKLSDELIAPNLDQEKSFFYEPSEQLRKRFDIYPEAHEAELNFFRELEQKQTQLLRQIQSRAPVTLRLAQCSRGASPRPARDRAYLQTEHFDNTVATDRRAA